MRGKWLKLGSLILLCAGASAAAERPPAKPLPGVSALVTKALPSDLDRDGDDDLVALAANRPGEVLWLESTADGRYVERTIARVGGVIRAAAAVDFDRDGDLDVVAQLGEPSPGLLLCEAEAPGRFVVHERSAPSVARSTRGGERTIAPPPPEISPRILLTPERWDAGTVPPDSVPARQVFQVHNMGPATLEVSGVGLGGTSLGPPGSLPERAFRLTHDCVALEPGTSCTVDVSYHPSSVGIHTALLRVFAEGWPGAAAEAPLSGSVEEVPVPPQEPVLCPPEEQVPVIVPPTTKVLGDDTLASLLLPLDQLCDDSDYCVLLFSGNPAPVEALAQGDTIVSGVAPTTPLGMLRRVQWVSFDSNHGLTLVGTTRASLTDAISQGSFCGQYPITVPVNLMADGTDGVAPAAVGGTYTAHFTLFDEAGTKIDGTVTFGATADLYLDVNIWQLRVERFGVEFTSTSKIDVDLVSTNLWDKHVSKTLAVYRFSPITIWIPAFPFPIPIVISPELSVTLGADGHLYANITAGAAAGFTMAAGIRYRHDSGWAPYQSSSETHSFDTPDYIGQARLEAYVRPEFALKFYGVAGPYLAVKAFGEANLDTTKAPWWWLDAGLHGDLGVKVEVLSRTLLDESWDLFDINLEKLAKGETISGHVTKDSGDGLKGVVLNGLPGPPSTDDKGFYSADLNFSWRSTVMPSAKGYTFEPSSWSSKIVVPFVPSAIVNFTAHGPVTVSGLVRTPGGKGVSGVTLSFVPPPPGSPIIKTGTTGAYTATLPYGWTGTVTPSFGLWLFSPASRSYSAIKANQTGQNFTAYGPITVSGTVRVGTSGLDKVTINVTGLAKPVETNPKGEYAASLPYGWSGTVTPAKAGYAFLPASRVYSGVRSNTTGQDFKATLRTFTISGYVRTSGGAGLGGVTMNGLPGNPKTLASGTDIGRYTATVPWDWAGTVTPTFGLYTFDPPSRKYGPVRANQPGQDYTAHPPVKLSGQVHKYSATGPAFAGVTVWLSTTGASSSTSTDRLGYWELHVPRGASGTIRPQFFLWTFSPRSRGFSKVTADQGGMDFIATPPLTISGTVMSGGSPLKDVRMGGLYKDGAPVKTDEFGEYSGEALPGWTLIVEPFLSGYAFDPPWRHYPSISADQKDQDYEGYRDRLWIAGQISEPKTGRGVDSVFLNGLGVYSLPDGTYRALVKKPFTGRVTPEKPRCSFSPAYRVYSLLTYSVESEDYKADCSLPPNPM